MNIENVSELHRIMDELRRLPEESDKITAYGYQVDSTDIDVLGDFANAVWLDDKSKMLKDDLVNAFLQLHAIDFESKHEGIEVFYDNFYEYNERGDVLRACNWFDINGFCTLSKIISEGYESSEKQKVACDWIDDNAAEIYQAYRKIMFEFEKKYL